MEKINQNKDGKVNRQFDFVFKMLTSISMNYKLCLCHYTLPYFTFKKLCINCDVTYNSVIGLFESGAKRFRELIIGNINKGSFKLICRNFKELRRSKCKVNCLEPKRSSKVLQRNFKTE